MPTFCPLEAVRFLRPFDDAIFVRLMMPTGASGPGSSLFIPEVAREEAFFAQAIACGPGRLHTLPDENDEPVFSPMLVKPKQIVFFRRYHGERFDINGSMYAMLKQDDILGIYADPANAAYDPTEDPSFTKYFSWMGRGADTDPIDFNRVIEGSGPMIRTR